MYICVCKAVTDKQIRHAANTGVNTSKELFKCLGVGEDCGKCVKHAKKILAEIPRPDSIMQSPSTPVFNAI